MGEKVKIRIGHLHITDHLILGINKDRVGKKIEDFKYAEPETVPMMGWTELASKLETDALDGAFILAPSAMDLFRPGVPLRLVMLEHIPLILLSSATAYQTHEELREGGFAISYTNPLNNSSYPGVGHDCQYHDRR